MARAAADNLGTHTMDKHFKLTYADGFVDPRAAAESDVGAACPSFDEPDVLSLDVGASHVDEDGDTWTRIA